MPTISNCGSKTASAVPPPFSPTGKNFQVGTWVTVLDFSGSVTETLVFRIQVSGSNNPLVDWRRLEDHIQVANGSFQGTADMTISPGATSVRIDVLVSEASASLNVTVVSGTVPGLI
jgi:hypothetical protein